MTSLPALLGRLVAVLQANPFCHDVNVAETKAFSAGQFYFKIRTALDGEYRLQVRIYDNRGHTDHAYQVFTDGPLLRRDSKEEFDHLDTFPHHHHDTEGYVRTSPLTGDPIQDIQIVLQAVELFREEETSCGS